MIVARGVVVVAVLVTAGPPSPATATRAFGRWLEQRYGAPRGYWTCPPAQVVRSRAFCAAEFRVGERRHFVDATARLSGGRVVISKVDETAWVRRWSRYLRRSLPGARTPGKASVNGGGYDWPWLAAGAYDGWKRGRASFVVNAYDGYSTGLRRFYVFRCVVRGDLVTCRNAFGDAMRYRPGA
jgi:hypothetical protein